MKPLNTYQRYLIEEFADEYHERRMSRRALLRRVLLITGSIPLTASVLTALGCGSGDGDGDDDGPARTADSGTAGASATATTTAASSTSTSVAVPEVEASDVTFDGPGSELFGYLARPAGGEAAPGILVIHENRGLNDHIRDVATRFAQQGFVALAVDLVSRNGGSKEDAAANTGFLGSADPEDLVADLGAYAGYLRQQPGVLEQGIGVVGYCFGGGYTWEAAVGVEGVLAAVPYYGPCRVIDELAGREAAILAIYGENDSRVTSQADEVRAALEASSVPFEVVVYPGANHAFFNDTGQNYDAEAASDAFDRTVDWFRRYAG